MELRDVKRCEDSQVEDLDGQAKKRGWTVTGERKPGGV